MDPLTGFKISSYVFNKWIKALTSDQRLNILQLLHKLQLDHHIYQYLLVKFLVLWITRTAYSTSMDTLIIHHEKGNGIPDKTKKLKQ